MTAVREEIAHLPDDQDSSPDEQDGRSHIVSELGFATRRSAGGLGGRAEVTPPMHVPGTARLRTSVLAIWADVLTGLLAADASAPQVPVTLELDVNLHRPAPGGGVVTGEASVIKRGRSVFVAVAEFADESGVFAIGAASFMASRDPGARLPARLSIDMPASVRRLTVPFAERAGCQRLETGVAMLARSADGLNASNTVNGGLIALTAEEAAVSLVPGGTLCSLHLRYLQPVRVGPLVATATAEHGLGRVELRDAGSDDRLAAVATTRFFPPPAAEGAPVVDGREAARR